MEVKEARGAFVSNQEVLSILSEAKERHAKERSLRQHNTVLYEAVKYLKDTPAAGQGAEAVRDCLRELLPVKLATAELLQVVNHRPETDVDLRILIEECDERLNDEQIQEILEIVARHLPAPAKPDT